MPILIDRAFAALLLLGAAGHTIGSFTLLGWGSDTQVWSLGSALGAALIGALNFLRAGRPDDRPIVWHAFVGALGWLAVVALFARTLPTPFDFRVIWHGLCALALAGFGLRAILQAHT